MSLSTVGVVSWRRIVCAAIAAALVFAGLPAPSAQAAPGLSVDLRVLLLSNGGPSTTALATLMDREGVPYTTVNLASSPRQVIDDAFLSDAATGRGHFQAVVTPDAAGTGLTVAEIAALTTYERSYGVRHVNAYAFPGAATGQSAASYSGSLDGGALTVTSQGLAGPFTYLTGSLTIDDFDPAAIEVSGNIAQALPSLPAGATFTPLVNVSRGGFSGTLIGVYAHDYREQLFINAAYNGDQKWFSEIGHGIVTWMTRGIHLGHHRNYLSVHVDDVFLPDSRWSSTQNCTPGDTPSCVDPTATEIRMLPSDVTRLVNWQNANGFKFDMLFNGQGSDAVVQDVGTDPLTNAFLAVKDQFTWVNHTYSHPFLGCIQIAPTLVDDQWHCATTADTTGFYDESLVPFAVASGGIQWLGPTKLLEEIQLNQQWAVSHSLPNFDPSALVTGEHSGLLTTPQQPIDNPFLGEVLDAAGIAYTGSDASRELETRQVAGGSTMTLPRHPMNIFYNAGRYADEVDEYNWIYTSAASGGSGICTANPDTSTCITPLANANATQAQASFTNYILPIEIRNAYRYVVTGDPRPFYAHQSNIAEDGILYPVVEGILDTYAATHNTAVSPMVTEDVVALGNVLTRKTAWAAVHDGVTAYIDGSGVHVAGPDGTPVPLTVPTGTVVNGDPLSAYDGELSGWLSATASGSVVAVPAIPMGGYIGHTVPDAPAAPLATPGAFDNQVQLAWTAPAGDGNAPITHYQYRVSLDTATPSWSAEFWPGNVTSATVFDLTPGADYIFQVRAVNAVGAGPWSASSLPVQRVAQASVASPDVTYGTAATVTLTVDTTWGHAPSGSATLTINGTSSTQGIVGNTATFSVPGLTTGVYAYTVDYGSDPYIQPLSRTGSVTVTKSAVTATGAVVTAPSPVHTGSYAVTVTQPTGLLPATGDVAVTLTGDLGTTTLTGTLSDGAVTLSVPTLAAGTWTASVAYAGDANYAPLTTPGAPVVSTKASVAVVGAVGTASSPQTPGTYEVTVTQETGLPDATGEVTVTLANGDLEPVIVTGTLAGGTVTLGLPELPAGTWAATVAYAGDLNYAVTSVGGASVVSTRAEVSVAGVVGTAPSPQTQGSYDVTVSQASGLAVPTGDVTVTLTGAGDPITVTGTLVGGIVAVDLPELPAGTWTASVAYAGDSNYSPATAVGASVESAKAAVTVAGAIVDAASPQGTGTYEVTVAQPTGLADPTGDVTVTLAHGLDSHTLTGTLSGGAVTVEVPILPVGVWIASIAYEGDANYAATTADGEAAVSTTAPVTVTGTVLIASTPQVAGSYDVTVAPPTGLAAPTGDVTVTLTRESDVVSVTGTLSGGAVNVALPALAAGTWTASIAYAGDANYAAGTVAGASVVSLKAAVTTVAGSVPTNPTTTTAGTFAVTVTEPSGLGIATGDVTVTLTKGSLTSNISGTLSGGAVTVAVPRLAAGTWATSVAYGGDANYAAMSVAGPTVTVLKGAVSKITTTVTKRPTTKASGSYKVTVTQPSGLAKATGKVTVTLKKGSSTKKVAGTLKSGTVTITVPKLANGVWKATVAYAGDATYASKTISASSVVVGKTTVSSLVSTVPKVPTTKAAGSYKVSVTMAAGLPTPTGKITVTLKKGSTTKKVTGTLSSGSVTITVPKLGKGTWKATVTYSGSSIYHAKTATGKSIVVTK